MTSPRSSTKYHKSHYCSRLFTLCNCPNTFSDSSSLQHSFNISFNVNTFRFSCFFFFSFFFHFFLFFPFTFIFSIINISLKFEELSFTWNKNVCGDVTFSNTRFKLAFSCYLLLYLYTVYSVILEHKHRKKSLSEVMSFWLCNEMSLKQPAISTGEKEIINAGKKSHVSKTDSRPKSGCLKGKAKSHWS